MSHLQRSRIRSARTAIYLIKVHFSTKYPPRACHCDRPTRLPLIGGKISELSPEIFNFHSPFLNMNNAENSPAYPHTKNASIAGAGPPGLDLSHINIPSISDLPMRANHSS